MHRHYVLHESRQSFRDKLASIFKSFGLLVYAIHDHAEFPYFFTLRSFFSGFCCGMMTITCSLKHVNSNDTKITIQSSSSPVRMDFKPKKSLFPQLEKRFIGRARAAKMATSGTKRQVMLQRVY